MKHQPIAAVEMKIKDEAVFEINKKASEVPATASTTALTTASTAAPTAAPTAVESVETQLVTVDSVLAEIKQEELSPPTNLQSNIETDSCETDNEDKHPVVQTKTRTRKRVIHSDTESGTESSNNIIQSNNKKQKIEPSTSSTASKNANSDVPGPVTETETETETIDENDIKVDQMKNFFDKLSDGNTKDSKNLLNEFEHIIGKEGFSNFKALITDTHEQETAIHYFNDIHYDFEEPFISFEMRRAMEKETERSVLACFDQFSGFVSDDPDEETILGWNPQGNENKSPESGKNQLVIEEILLPETETTEEKGEPIPALDKIEENALDKIKEKPVVEKDKTFGYNLEKDKSRESSNPPPVAVTVPSVESVKVPDSKCATEVISKQNAENTFKPKATTSNENYKPKMRSISHDTPLMTSPSPSRILKSMEKTVCNLSYTPCRVGIQFKCICENCDVKTCNNQLLKYHVKSRHLQVMWSGFCKLCNKKVSHLKSLEDEFNHMYNEHVLKEAGTNTNPPPKESHDDQDQPPKEKRIRQESMINNSKSTPEAQNDTKSAEKINEKVVAPLPTQTDALINLTKHSNANESSVSEAVTVSNSSKLLKVTTLPLSPKPLVNMILSTGSNITETALDPTPTTSTALNSPVESSLSKPVFKLQKLSGKRLACGNDKNGEEPVSHAAVVKAEVTADQRPVILNKLTSNTRKNVIVLPAHQKLMLPSFSHSKLVAENAESKLHKNLSLNLFKKTKSLKPWLDVDDCKAPVNVAKMLKEDCLVDMFKCMSKSCAFHSKDVESFRSHLLTHELQEVSDICNYGRCSYCSFSTVNITTLTKHIQTEHKFDRFACTKCFYRSIVVHHVTSHQMRFHEDDSKTVLDCVAERIDLNQETSEVMKSRPKFISPVKCFGKISS